MTPVVRARAAFLCALLGVRRGLRGLGGLRGRRFSEYADFRSTPRTPRTPLLRPRHLRSTVS